MSLSDNMNWNDGKSSFEHFLSHRLNLPPTCICMVGIAWNTNTCWYILNATEQLQRALGIRFHLSTRHALLAIGLLGAIAGIIYLADDEGHITEAINQVTIVVHQQTSITM